MKHYDIKVPGAKASGALAVTSPFDGSQVATVETINADGAEIALQNAANAFNDRRHWLDAAQRISILEKTAALMAERFEHLVAVAVAEGGKPLTDTRVEVTRAIDGVKNCIECLRSEHGSEIPMRLNPASMGRTAFTRLQPIGPVMAVSAFNHPLNLIVHQVGPAVASGCPVIIKPAEDTPASCFEFVEILREAGLPELWCQPVVVNDLALAEKLVTDPRIAFFGFIGSARVGWRLKSKLAPGTRCALEHGGIAPVIVAEDADLDAMLPLLAKGGLYHAGQVCVSVQRVYAQRAIVERVADGLAELARAQKTGDPAQHDTDIGPLIRPAEVDRVEQWVNAAVNDGATLLCGGKRLSDTLYMPTILLNPPDDAIVSRREIFGPVICVYEYEQLDDAIRCANDTPFSFQASVMTQDIDTAMHVSERLNGSAIMVNDHTAFRVDWMPFAGLKQSGYGVGGIPYTYRDMHTEKLVVIKSPGL